jgi:cytoskeletal protein RodZ
MAKKDKAKKGKDKSGTKLQPAGLISAAIIVLLLIAGVGFLVFGLIQSTSNGGDTTEDAVATEEQADSEEDASEEGTSEDDTDGTDETQEGADVDSETGSDTAEGGESDSDSDTDTETDADSTADQGDRINKYPETSTTYSRGNDYQFGDITGDTYETERGDTLWQIAEGKYGSGYAWVDINRANGGFALLPDGTPVNLPVGYQLELPNLE